MHAALAKTTEPPRPATTDTDLRALVRNRLTRELVTKPDTVIIDELGILRGQSRVDVAVVNGVLHGFELKSERDSLRRLKGQVKAYGLVVDRATLVATEKHLDHAAKVVPAWWELTAVRVRRGHLCLATVRRGKLNPGLNVRAVAELLWYDEAIHL